MSVLVVDDHAVFADALKARLEAEPDLHPVVVAYSVAEAGKRLSSQVFDIAVVDFSLVDGTGLDVLARARRITPGTRVVVLTASDEVEPAVEALLLGARAWLSKTVDTGYLIRVIRGVAQDEIWLAPELLGRVMPMLIDRTTEQPQSPLTVLTAREREVLDYMVSGLGRAEIASRLGLSVNTVRTHTQNLIAKLGVHSSLEAVALALQNGGNARPKR
jgi:DNA-binding NarL/FixJ family response regulator